MTGSTAPDPLPGFHDRAPADRYCDLVLTGGVTSSIAYPGLLYALGQAYRFHAVGGASSGAGVAALAAAAEYRRRRGSVRGFERMAERVAQVADAPDGRTNLSRLFQPAAGHERLFDALLRAVALPTGRVRHVLIDTLRAYRRPLWWGALAGAAVGWALSLMWWVVVLLAVAGALMAVVRKVWRDILRLADHDYGLCDGLSRRPGETHDPFTPWLHALIQDIAGRAPGDAPLTFADLHGAAGSPQQTLGLAGADAKESIRLQIITANVTLGEPVTFPRQDDNSPLYFREDEMRALFPAPVVEHLLAHSALEAAARDVPVRQAPAARGRPAGPLHVLPNRGLPILVAARMSVTVPLLFTAVPLWREDPRSPPDAQGAPPLRRCLMQDGGLCSNFPVHLFDSLVPAWPTFAVHLRDLQPGEAPDPGDVCRVDLPRPHSRNPDWNGFDEAKAPGVRLFGLAGAMLDTIMNWTDRTQARLPGVRERVATVSLPPGLGGLNMLMDSEQIRTLARQGPKAARLLLQRFSMPPQGQAAVGAAPGTGQAPGWDEHRRMRFRLAVSALRQGVRGLAQAARTGRHATPLHELLRADAEAAGPPAGAAPQAGASRDAAAADAADSQAYPRPLRADQAAALEGALAALEQLEATLAPCDDILPPSPYPRPEIRVRSPI